MFGSVEYTPSTSVYISQVSALKILATATAVASEPPLPIVVISPVLEIPWKPGTIATSFLSKNYLFSQYLY